MAATEAPKSTTDNVTPLKKEAAEVPGRVSTAWNHPMAKRIRRNAIRTGGLGIGYTLIDEAINATSWKSVDERVAVIYVPKKKH